MMSAGGQKPLSVGLVSRLSSEMLYLCCTPQVVVLEIKKVGQPTAAEEAS